MDKKLVLFDIDGTLISRGSGHDEIFDLAIEQVAGKPIDIHDFNVDGCTDFSISKIILRSLGFSEEKISELAPKIIERETELFLEAVKNDPIKPAYGAKKLLQVLTQKNCRIGLVTGNPKKVAFGKVESAGIAEFFSFGGFGGTVMERQELIQMALDEVKEKFGEEYLGKDIVVFGDTAKDIESVKPFNAKVIAVLTGVFSKEDLEPSNPDYIFNDLTNTEKILKAIFSD